MFVCVCLFACLLACLFACLLACLLAHSLLNRSFIPPLPPSKTDISTSNPTLFRFPKSSTSPFPRFPFFPSRSDFSPLRASSGSSWAISRVIAFSESSRPRGRSFRSPIEFRVRCEFDRFPRIAPSSSSPFRTPSPPTTRAACTGSCRSPRATLGACSRSAWRNRSSINCGPSGKWGTSCGPCSAIWPGARDSWSSCRVIR